MTSGGLAAAGSVHRSLQVTEAILAFVVGLLLLGSCILHLLARNGTLPFQMIAAFALIWPIASFGDTYWIIKRLIRPRKEAHAVR